MEPLVVERVASSELMMALVSAGFALGLVGASHFSMSNDQSVVTRPLSLRLPPLMTYLLHPGGEPPDVLLRFIERVRALESLSSQLMLSEKLESDGRRAALDVSTVNRPDRSEEHTSELQSLMRISY